MRAALMSAAPSFFEAPFAREASCSRAGDAVPITTVSGARALPTEIAFLAAHGVPTELQQCAATIARSHGVSADAILLAEGGWSRLSASEPCHR
jgi:hypothetical protein